MISRYYIFIVSFFITANAVAATCYNPKTECVEGRATRDKDGVSVMLDCWRYRTTYECKESSDNNCKQLRDQGCSQTQANCRTMWAGSCAVQDETFSCPVERCDEAGEIVCGKDLFCVGGGCFAATPTKNKKFDKAAASLDALNAAADEIKKQNTDNPQIFAGRVMECSSYALPGITKDCCNDNSGLFSCDTEEKELSQMKKTGRAIEIGEYCNNKEPITKTCTSHHTAYCVFGSRIARIIQNDGRRKQLGIGFGYVNDDAKSSYVDCRGITKDELAQMKFDQMDFSELYAEIRKKAEVSLPTNETLKQKTGSSTYDSLKERSAKTVAGFTSEQKVGDRIGQFYERAKK